MAQVHKDFIITKIEEMGYPYFIIYDADGKTRLYQNIEDKDASATKSASLLRDFFDKTTGTVNVEIRQNAGTQGGDYRHVLKLQTNLTPANSGPYITGANGPQGADVERLLQLQRENFEAMMAHQAEQHKRDLQILDLKREIEAAKNSDFFEKYGDKIAGLLPYILNRGQMAAPVVNGVSQAEAGPAMELLERLSNADPEYLTHLGQLVKLAETKPEMYAQGIDMINKLV